MAKRRPYSKPEITRVDLDQSITLMMASAPGSPDEMMPKGDGSKGTDTPFSSPFDNKPFS